MPTLTLDVSDALMRKVNYFATSRGETVPESLVKLIDRNTDDAPAAASEYGTPEEIYASLHGPTRTAKESDAIFRKKYNIPDELVQLTPDELADRADATIASFAPEKIAELERMGIL